MRLGFRTVEKILTVEMSFFKLARKSQLSRSRQIDTPTLCHESSDATGTRSRLLVILKTLRMIRIRNDFQNLLSLSIKFSCRRKLSFFLRKENQEILAFPLNNYFVKRNNFFFFFLLHSITNTKNNFATK